MKKFAIFLICFAIFCALCACGETEPTPSGVTPSVEPVASTEPSAEPSVEPDASVEPSAEPSAPPSEDVSAAPSAEPSDEPTATPTLPPVQHFADLSDYDVVEDGNTVYPIVIRYMDASNIGDGVVELSKQFIEQLTGEPIDAVRAMRFENVKVAEATVGGDRIAVYNIAVSLTMQDGFPPDGDLWEEDHSHGFDDHGWYYNTYAAHKPCMMAVTLNGELFCAANADMLSEKYDIDAQFWHSAEEAEPMLRAVYEEYIADEPQDGYEFELSPDWVTHGLLFGVDIEVLDADGTDITAEFYELWRAAESAYRGGFEYGGMWETGVYEAIPGLSGYMLTGVEERLDELFTENGRAQILDAVQGGLPLLMHREEDDTWWHPEERSSGWSVDLLGVETLGVSDGRVELMLHLGGHNAPEWSASVRFVMVETADGWRIDDYLHYMADYGQGELYRVIEGYDVDFMTYIHNEGYLSMENPRFLGGFCAEKPTVAHTWLYGDELTVRIEYDGNRWGLSASPTGPRIEFTIDLVRGALTGQEYTKYDRAPSVVLEYTDAELLSWGLMLADVIDDAAAGFYAEYGEFADHNIEVFDADGVDITGEVVYLWETVNRVYNVDDLSLYPNGEIPGHILNPAHPSEMYHFGYLDEMQYELFTEDGLKQLDRAMTVDGEYDMFLYAKDDIWFRKSHYKDEWAMGGIRDAKALSATADRIELLITYDAQRVRNGMEIWETVEFAIAKEDGVWKVDGYRYPDAVYDPDPMYTAVGDGVYRISGYDADELIYERSTGTLRFTNPRFVGELFLSERIEGYITLTGDELEAGFTIDADGEGVIEGPSVWCRLTLGDEMYDYTVIEESTVEYDGVSVADEGWWQRKWWNYYFAECIREAEKNIALGRFD